MAAREATELPTITEKNEEGASIAAVMTHVDKARGLVIGAAPKGIAGEVRRNPDGVGKDGEGVESKESAIEEEEKAASGKNGTSAAESRSDDGVAVRISDSQRCAVKRGFSRSCKSI